MKIPANELEKRQFVEYVIGVCMSSAQDRRTLYDRRRRYFLFGQDEEVKVKFNRLKSHMKLVGSFLFSPDGLVYNIAPPKNADDATVQQFLALQDDWNEDVHDSGLADVIGEAVIWGLNYDTMIIKQGWNDIAGQGFGKLLSPACFGVWNESEPDFASQPAMNHRYTLDYDEAAARLRRAGRAEMIPLLQESSGDGDTGLPPAISNIIISAVTGAGLVSSSPGSIIGNINPNYAAAPMFRARSESPQVTFDETWIWDSDAKDWRIFHSLNNGVVLLSDSEETIDVIRKTAKDEVEYSSTTNWFIEKENPFTPLTPFPLYDYFWGDAHMEDIIPLQDWSTKRLVEIDEVLEAQTDPLQIGHSMTGLVEEKASLDYGAFYNDDSPTGKFEEHRPPMPEDLFREFNEIGGLMMEASMLTEVTAGKSSGGARGGQQQKQMQITGGGGIRKTAIGLESALVRIGEIGLRLKMKNDDTKIRLEDGSEFIAAQCPDGYSLRVDGHSHSPLFTLESRELAAMLFKARAIDREWLLRLVNPTQKVSLLHALRKMEAAEAKAQQQQLAAGAMKHSGKK